MSTEYQGLCFRCEHRARFLEGHGRPRYECGEVQSQKVGCYMFRPAALVVLARYDGDRRPAFGPWMFSARMHGVRLIDGPVKVRRVKGGMVAEVNPNAPAEARRSRSLQPDVGT